MCGSHQPAEPELHRRRAAAHAARHRPRSRRAQRVLRLLGAGARVLRAVRHRAARPAAPKFICTKCPAASTRISRSRPPAWASAHRWPEIARTYARGEPALRRHREGHAVSSKVVGDMALFLFTPRHQARRRGQPRTRRDAVSRDRVIDMLSGGLGWPDGRLAEGRATRRARRKTRSRSAKTSKQANPARSRPARISKRPARNSPRSSNARRPTTISTRYLMYPQVFADFAKYRARVQRCQRAADARLFLRPEARRGNLGRHRGRQSRSSSGSINVGDAGQGRPPHRQLTNSTACRAKRSSSDKIDRAENQAAPKADPADPLQVARADSRD